MGDADWVRIDNDLYVESAKYSAIKLRSGTYSIEIGKEFAVSVLVDIRGFAEHSGKVRVQLEAGRLYRLRAERTYGRGYKVFFWIEDVKTGRPVFWRK